ncbi:MAG: HAD-IC family P-type ATPase [Brumimicrobium sp.]
MEKNKIQWHQISSDEALEKLNSSLFGLSFSDVQDRNAAYGKNKLPSKKRLTLFRIIINQFLNPLIYILLAASAVSIILQEYTDAGFIFFVLLLNAVIGAYQEWKAESKASELEEMIRLKVKVKRNGNILITDSEELVPGDIVMLESGNKVPADIRILKGNNLTALEAILTGESMAVNKNSETLEREETPVSDRFNMLFAGTTITTGRATGVVVFTGLNTEIGKIATSLKELVSGKTPLVRRMETFTKRISLIILGACLLLGGVGYFTGIPIEEIFFFVVAVAVSAIPEGLPIAMTVALAIGASKMAKRHVIIRKLTAVEGLGSCTYIATDKTGTLTVDQQTARAIVLPRQLNYTVSGEGYNGIGGITDKDNKKVTYNASLELEQMIRSVVICNEGELLNEGDSWTNTGDPIDVALLALAYKAKISPLEITENIIKVSEVPFESERKYAAIYFRENNDNTLRIAVKGAIEQLKEKIDQEKNKELLEAVNHYAENGYRIIAVGGGPVDEVKPVDELPKIDLFGFIALIDPLRPEAKAAVKECFEAGVMVAMITGDHPATALAIAKDVGIAENKEQLFTGMQLEGIASDEALLKEVLNTKRVFSRVSPQQKQLIVEVLRKSDHFIAVTGDGVNDAPALKTANIGVAMGYGTDVAKDNASIIITDNNFASIAAGIEEGRYTFSNLRKIVYLLISSGASELLAIGLSLSFGLPLLFLPVQLLWLNLVTNGIQDVALAFEAGEKQVMKEPPRKPNESIFDPLMIKQTLISASVMCLLAFGLWYHLLNHLHWDEAIARNAVVLLFVLLQNFHALNARSETRSIFKIPLRHNYVLVFGILAAQGIHILAMHIPFMQGLLSLSPVPWQDWLKLFFTASILIGVMEIFKYILSISGRRKKLGSTQK